jgi:hypothetical protein
MGVTAAMAFSSQSVITLADAAAGTPIASQAPTITAGTEPLLVQPVEARMFLLHDSAAFPLNG